MDKVLQGLKGTHCYPDEILVIGISREDAVPKTEAVLQRLLYYGIKTDPSKSELLHSSSQFLG